MRAAVASFVLSLAYSAPCAQGEVISRDWLEPGDGLLTYDTVNQREWLDLSVSALRQFEEPRIENAVAEVRPGGMFEGFTLARQWDVAALAESAGVDTGSGDFEINESPTRHLIDVVGTTHTALNGSTFSIGWLNDYSQEEPDARFAAYIALLPESGALGLAGVTFTDNSDLLRLSSHGLFLYRRAVPEPTSLLLAFIACLCCVRAVRAGVR